MGSLRRAVGTLALAAMLCLSSGCIFDGLVYDDGTGISRGPSRDGLLLDGSRLPVRGQGLWIPPRWSSRGLNFGIDEMVSLLVYAGRAVDMRMPGRVLSVGDISRAVGGRSQWHRSHQTGRDVDLIFFMRDEDGRAIDEGDEMLVFGPDGLSVVPPKSELPRRRFDVAANWELVTILLDNPIAEVQYIFVQDDLRMLMLEHGRAAGAPTELLARAGEVMRQPSDSAPHDDHFHVRIYCPKSDLDRGCVDFGQMRWHKKDLKYERRAERSSQRQPIELGPLLRAKVFLR